MRRHISPGVVLGAIAVFVAMSGSAYAAAKITGAQIKDGTVTSADIRNNSLTTADLSNGAVNAMRGHAGPAGPAGPAGAAGPAGPSVVGALNTVSSAQVPFGPTDVVMGAVAYCPSGQRVVSGGGISVSDEQIAASEPTTDRAGWVVIGIDLSDDGGEYVQAQALCAPAGTAVAASAGHSASNAHIAALVRRIRATVHAH